MEVEEVNRMLISLRAARVNAEMTQKQAGSAIGVDKSTIINWEMGRSYPRIDQLQRLCAAYQIPVDYIFCAENQLKVDSESAIVHS